MGKFVLAVCVILCTALLGMAIPQQQQEQKPPKTEQKPPKTEEPAKAAAKTIAGEVVSVDATKNEIVIKDEAGVETKLLVSESTKFMKDGKAITLADVKGGEKLTSECEESSDPCKAKIIHVTSKPQGEK